MNYPQITSHHIKSCTHCQHVMDTVNHSIKNHTFLRMARKLTHNHAQAQDLVQLTATKIIRKSHHYTKGNFNGYAKVIMSRIFLNQIRSTQTETSKKDRLLSIQNMNYCTVNFSIEQQDYKILIQQMYNSLNEDERSLFILLYKEFKHREIAKILDINLNTCHGRIRNLKLKLKNNFAY
jgi:RNA polymerase sigma factor (sigma-70 family)